MDRRHTPPYSTATTPDIENQPMLLSSQPSISPPSKISNASFTPTLAIPTNPSQALIDSTPKIKRWQQDLLILTGFMDNSTLHWRPTWFNQAEQFANNFWTLQNPPNVVTELLPLTPLGRPVTTRRMRRRGDPPPLYVKSWEHWLRYCGLYGIPLDFLSEQQVALMRLGLPRSSNGMLCEPSTYPLYPEPRPRDRGRFLLNRDMYQNLPRKFQRVHPDEVIVVHSDGALQVAPAETLYFHDSQWTHYGGRGEYVHDWWYDADPDALKVQGAGRRWTYLPWTKEQEISCRPMKLKLKLGSRRQQSASIVGENKKAKASSVAVETAENSNQDAAGLAGDMINVDNEGHDERPD